MGYLFFFPKIYPCIYNLGAKSVMIYRLPGAMINEKEEGKGAKRKGIPLHHALPILSLFGFIYTFTQKTQIRYSGIKYYFCLWRLTVILILLHASD